MNFRKVAKEAIKVSDLAENREKISTEELIEKYPEKITISQFERCEMGNKVKFIYTIKEEPEKFAYAGILLEKCFNKIIQAYGGDYVRAQKEFAMDKTGLPVKLEKKETLDGHEVTNVTIL